MPFASGPYTVHTHYKSKMADGRQLGKIEKSLYLGRGSSDFDKIWHTDAVRPFWLFRPLKFEISKIQDGGSRHLKKSKIEISRQWFDRSPRNLARWCSSTLLTVPTDTNLKFWKNSTCWQPPSWKIENWHISAVVWAISTKVGTLTHFVRLDRSDR